MLCYGPVFEILIYTRSLIHSTSVRKQNQGASSLSSLYWESLKSHGTKSLPHLREASSKRKSSSDASAFLRRPPWVTLPLFFTSKLEQDRWCHSFRCSTFWSRGTDCFLRRTAAERREGRKTHNYSFEDTQLHSVRFPPPKRYTSFSKCLQQTLCQDAISGRRYYSCVPHEMKVSPASVWNLWTSCPRVTEWEANGQDEWWCVYSPC